MYYGSSRAPLVPVAVATMCGIALAHHCHIPTVAWLAAMAVLAASMGVVMLAKRDDKRVAAWLAAAFFLALGGLLCHADASDAADWTEGCPRKTMLRVRLMETPVIGERSVRAKAEVYEVDGRTARGSMRLYLRPDSLAKSLAYGDRLLLHGYPDTVRRTLYATSDHYLVTSHDGTSLRARSERIRMRLLGRMRRGPLATGQAGVAEALTLGWKADLDQETRDDFRDAGIAHLLAVSGLHVGLLTVMIGWLLVWLGKERRGRLLRGAVQLLAVWGYCLVTGLAPSTIRAALMFSLFVVADCLSRRTSSVNLLATSAIVTLLSCPTLLFDVGWQLSYAAVLGILLAQPVIQSFHGRLSALPQAAAVSIAATLATLPIMLACFHRFTPYFLIANVFIVPLASVVLLCSLLYMAVPCGVTAFMAEYTIKPMQWVTDLVSGLPHATIEGIHLSNVELIVLSGVVLLLFLAIEPAYAHFRRRR